MNSPKVFYENEKLIKLSNISRTIKRLERWQEKKYGHSLMGFNTVMQLIGEVQTMIINRVKYIKNGEYIRVKNKLKKHFVI